MVHSDQVADEQTMYEDQLEQYLARVRETCSNWVKADLADKKARIAD